MANPAEASWAMRAVEAYKTADTWKKVALVAAAAAATAGVAALTLSKNTTAARKPASRGAPKTQAPKKPAPPGRTDSKLEQDDGDAADLPKRLFPADLSALTADQKRALALECKVAGNALYKQQKYREAIRAYDQAIALAPDAVYYSNRAACHSMLHELEAVLDDCDAALALDSTYVKVLTRRAMTLTALGRIEPAIVDYMTVCFLEDFSNASVSANMDTLLKQWARDEAERIVAQRGGAPQLPNRVIVQTFTETFPSIRATAARHAPLAETAGAGTPERQFGAAMAALARGAYAEASAELRELDPSLLGNEDERLDALLMQGTFLCICGAAGEAQGLFDEILAARPTCVPAMLRRAAAYIERGETAEAETAIEAAIDGGKCRDAEAYFQRAQMAALTLDPASPPERVADAATRALADLERAIELQPDYVMAQIQLGVAHMRVGNIEKSRSMFDRLVAEHGAANADVWTYYGEVLMETQQIDDALAAFDRAAELRPGNPIPHINKSVVALQMQQKPDEAEAFARRALAEDPTFDLVYMQLAQIMVTTNRLAEAVTFYEKAIEYGRGSSDVQSYLSCLLATRAQQQVFERYPSIADKMRQATTPLSM